MQEATNNLIAQSLPQAKLETLAPQSNQVLDSSVPDESRVDPRKNLQVLSSANEIASSSTVGKSYSFFETYINNPEKTKSRNLGISYVNALLHALATVTSFGDSSSMKLLNKFFHKSAFLFTRYLAPLSSYGLAAINAFMKKDLAEGLIKAIPPLFLPFVGDANVDTVYGLSTSLNQPYDMLAERVRADAHKSQEHKNFSESKGDLANNLKLIKNEAKSLWKEFMQGKLSFWKQSIYLYNCPLILGGSLPMLLFARNARDTFLAKSLGLLRAAGGILGDIGFLFGEKDIYKKLVGVMCSISAISSIAKRWVKSDNYANALIHLSSALDVSAMALWNTFSGTRGSKSH
jgi:hypothetical protein